MLTPNPTRRGSRPRLEVASGAAMRTSDGFVFVVPDALRSLPHELRPAPSRSDPDAAPTIAAKERRGIVVSDTLSSRRLTGWRSGAFRYPTPRRRIWLPQNEQPGILCTATVEKESPD